MTTCRILLSTTRRILLKTFIKILAGLGALVVIAISVIVFLTSGMSDTADKFFIAAKLNNYKEAYSYLSEDFKESTSVKELEVYLHNNAFNNYKESNWDSRSVNGGRGELKGSISTTSGGVIPVTLGFIKGDSDWKIYSISKPTSGLHEETEVGNLPSEKEQIQLVSKAMHVFAVSISEKSMNKMFNYVSSLWQRQYSIDKFEEAFGSFYQLGDSLLILDQYSPKFTDKATIDENGVLKISGLYPTNPNQVIFEQKYIYEGIGWKLLGFNIQIK